MLLFIIQRSEKYSLSFYCVDYSSPTATTILKVFKMPNKDCRDKVMGKCNSHDNVNTVYFVYIFFQIEREAREK